MIGSLNPAKVLFKICYPCFHAGTMVKLKVWCGEIKCVKCGILQLIWCSEMLTIQTWFMSRICLTF